MPTSGQWSEPTRQKWDVEGKPSDPQRGFLCSSQLTLRQLVRAAGPSLLADRPEPTLRDVQSHSQMACRSPCSGARARRSADRGHGADQARDRLDRRRAGARARLGACPRFAQALVATYASLIDAALILRLCPRRTGQSASPSDPRVVGLDAETERATVCRLSDARPRARRARSTIATRPHRRLHARSAPTCWQ